MFCSRPAKQGRVLILFAGDRQALLDGEAAVQDKLIGVLPRLKPLAPLDVRAEDLAGDPVEYFRNLVPHLNASARTDHYTAAPQLPSVTKLEWQYSKVRWQQR